MGFFERKGAPQQYRTVTRPPGHAEVRPKMVWGYRSRFYRCHATTVPSRVRAEVRGGRCGKRFFNFGCKNTNEEDIRAFQRRSILTTCRAGKVGSVSRRAAHLRASARSVGGCVWAPIVRLVCVLRQLSSGHSWLPCQRYEPNAREPNASDKLQTISYANLVTMGWLIYNCNCGTLLKTIVENIPPNAPLAGMF